MFNIDIVLMLSLAGSARYRQGPLSPKGNDNW